jgi:hypothetical protein
MKPIANSINLDVVEETDIMTLEETANALRERGHHVEMLDGERGVILQLDGRPITIAQAQDLLGEEIEVEEP